MPRTKFNRIYLRALHHHGYVARAMVGCVMLREVQAPTYHKARVKLTAAVAGMFPEEAENPPPILRVS